MREDHLSGRGQAGGWHDWTQILWRWCPEVGDTAHPLNIGTGMEQGRDKLADAQLEYQAWGTPGCSWTESSTP